MVGIAELKVEIPVKEDGAPTSFVPLVEAFRQEQKENLTRLHAKTGQCRSTDTMGGVTQYTGC